jgi:hypothetical protein
VSGHAKMPPASHQVAATSLKLLIQQIHPHVRVERDSGMCVAHDLYELWGRSPYTRMFGTGNRKCRWHAREDPEQENEVILPLLPHEPWAPCKARWV